MKYNLYFRFAIVILLSNLFFNSVIFGQSQDKFSYQTVIRNNNFDLITNTTVGVRISILRGTTEIYSEVQNPTTNANGLISIEIGGGMGFNTIDWSVGPFFIKTEIDITGGSSYTIIGTSQLLSVPFALYAKTAENIVGGISETDPIYSASTAAGITALDTAYWNNKLDSIIEADPIFIASIAAGISAIDTAYWNSKLDSIVEADPLFIASIAAGITAIDTAYWNSKLDSIIEADPLFIASIAAGITAIDTAYWNNKLDNFIEADPVFAVSIAAGITALDTAYWNSKLDSFTAETDPVFTASIAAGITALDTAYWNSKLDSFTVETDPIFAASIAAGITALDTAYWNNKLDSFTVETDPIFAASIAAGITALDTANWNNPQGSSTQNLADVLTQGNDGNAVPIKNIGDPSDPQDAATKAYVDALEAKISILENALISAGFIVKDIDGNSYSTLTIGTQVWLGENLKVTHFNDGTPITLVNNATDWMNLGTTYGYSWFNDDIGNKELYGAYYNWYAIDGLTNGSRNICPVGWQVPSLADFSTLISYLGGASIAGEKLKEAGITHWLNPNIATNESGFTALPGGLREASGLFYYDGELGFWWSRTEDTPFNAWYLYLENTAPDAITDPYLKELGQNIRCIKD